MKNTKKKHIFFFILYAISTLSIQAQNENVKTIITSAEATEMCKTHSHSTVSIHDPSIVFDQKQKLYYIFGSHCGVGKSNDAYNWTSVNNSKLFGVINENGQVVSASFNEAFKTNQTKQVKALVGSDVKNITFGNFDAQAWHCALPSPDNGQSWTTDGNMWAPDVVYNPTMQKWCYYLSLNGPTWNSCIILLTADNPEGPYVYQGPVVYSGFINNTDERISYRHTDLEIALGTQNGLPDRYNKGNSWGTYWPHAIDPCVFYDNEENLWMAYGSWSGGIYMLELDEKTGLRDYTVNYPSNYSSKGAGVTSDPYFGKKIAGGYYVSGEGAYIQHIGNYYYLFVSYGGYAPDGGYEMRVFRSEKPDGPYADTQGISAIFTSWQLNYGAGATSDRGEKLLGSYNQWGLMNVGECAQGHNSAIVDDQGRSFVVYHTKFNDGTVGHLVRTHQLFTTSNGWLVAAPFEFKGETANNDSIATREKFSKEEIAGEYQIMIHKYGMNHEEYEEITPITITLNIDGTISGAMTGTWNTTNGTSYATISLNGTTYKGVWIEQHLDPSHIKMLCFTAVSDKGVNVWGARMYDQYSVAYNIKNIQFPIKSGETITKNIALQQPTSYGATLKWTSSDPDVISESGKYAPKAEITPVDLTAQISCGNYYWEHTYKVNAQKEIIPAGDYLSGLKAYYHFNEASLINQYNTDEKGTLFRQTNGKKPTLEEDNERFGKVIHQYFGYPSANTSSYTRFPNPLYGIKNLEGFTLSLWVKRADDNGWDALWSFYNAANPAGQGSRLYMTGNSYIGYNDGAGNYFDINYPNTSICNYIPVGQWTLVTLTFSVTSGFKLYVNGAWKTNMNFASSAGNKATDFEYESVVSFLKTAPYLYMGYGSFWGSAEVYMDDLMVYDRMLSSTDVRALSTMSNRVTDFTIGIGGTSIQEIKAKTPAQTIPIIHDLSGRRVHRPTKGIYIINGKKVIY